MGTSSSSGGPSGSGPGLLPPWAPEAPSPLPNAPAAPAASPQPAPAAPPAPQQSNPPPPAQPSQPIDLPLPSVTWRSPKVSLGNYVGGKRGSSLGKVATGYVKASGGAKGATLSSRSGRRATATLAAFISDSIKNGVAEAARRRGIPNITSLNVHDAIATIVEIIAPPGSRVEDAIARKAQLETLRDIFEKFDIEAKGIDALDALNESDMEFVLQSSIANYINERFEQELIHRIEQSKISAEKANKISNEIKQYIFNVVKLDLSGLQPLQIDWENTQGQEIIENMYLKAFDLLGSEE